MSIRLGALLKVFLSTCDMRFWSAGWCQKANPQPADDRSIPPQLIRPWLLSSPAQEGQISDDKQLAASLALVRHLLKAFLASLPCQCNAFLKSTDAYPHKVGYSGRLHTVP